jgi:hypothetical protein
MSVRRELEAAGFRRFDQRLDRLVHIATVQLMPDRLLRLLDHPLLARVQTALFVGTVLVPALALLVAGFAVVVVAVVIAVAWQLLIAPTVAVFLLLWWLFGLMYRRRRSGQQLDGRVATASAEMRVPLRTARALEVSEGEERRIAAHTDPRFDRYRASHAGKLAPAGAMTPLERWLQGRIDEQTVIVRERRVRGDAAYLERMGAWDSQNLDELAGINPQTLQIDRAAAVAPELADSYRADPRHPGRVDGIEPPHSIDGFVAYYERRLDWLNDTLRKLRDIDEAEPPVTEVKPEEPVSPEHRDMLKSVAASLLSYLRASQTAYYGKKGDEHNAQAFQDHFPEIRGQVDTWNARVDARERARDELRGWVASRLHTMHYDRAPFCGGLDNPIAAEALADAPRLNLKEVHGCLHIGPYPVVVLPSMKTLDPNWEEIPKVNRDHVERELQEIAVQAAGRPERQQARDAARSLPEVGDPLAAELELIQAKDVIRGLGDCELCR